MTTEEKIKVMHAYVDGKQIQTRSNLIKNSLFKSDWVDMSIEPSWDWVINDYRIKPEPKKPTYRPYKDTDEMIADIKERFKVDLSSYAIPLTWIKRRGMYEYSLITDYNDDTVRIDNMSWDFAELFKHYIYLDGSPCGKLVEE